jgi:primosomal protein N'
MTSRQHTIRDSDQRPVCSECETTMSCSKNEVRVDCGHGYVKSGDEYTCPSCNIRVIVGFGSMWQPEEVAA